MVSAAESLELEFVTSKLSRKTPLWPLFFNVGQVNKHFVGRNEQLIQLKQIYDNSSSDKLVMISGLGGIGKTELTKKFAHEMHNKGDTSCTWFNGETEESLNQSFNSLGNKIGIRTISKEGGIRKTPELFKDLVEFISNNNESTFWLVIFDNVDELFPDLLSCLQLLHEIENTLAILTSRNRSLAKEDWKLISLEEWETADAKEFVKRFLSIATSQEDASIVVLCKRLGNHALAMQQAVAYIIQQQRNSEKGSAYSISDYVIEFDAGGKNAGHLLNHKLSEVSHKFAKTTFVTWDITIAKIKESQGEIGELAASILNRIAYFDPNDIALDFVEKVVKNQEPILLEGLIKQAVKLLKAYSLIRIENYVIKIHRLVQEVMRIKLKSSKQETMLVVSLLETIQKLPSTSKANMNQELSVWKYFSNNDNLIRVFPLTAMHIFNRMVDNGLYLELLNYCTCYHSRLREVLGEDHLATLGMKQNSAWALDAGRELVKSLEVYKGVCEKMKKILGPEDKLTLTAVREMAGVLAKLKRFDEAADIYKKVLHTQKKTLGRNSVETLKTMHAFADLYILKRELSMALGMFEDVLECKLELQALGENVNISTTRLHIGYCLFQQGKFLEAKEIFENILELRKVALGEEHLETLIPMHMMGETHLLLGNVEASLKYLKQVFKLRNETLGPTHPDTLFTQERISEIDKYACGRRKDESVSMDFLKIKMGNSFYKN